MLSYKINTFNKRKKNITIFVRICSPQNLKRDNTIIFLLIIIERPTPPALENTLKTLSEEHPQDRKHI